MWFEMDLLEARRLLSGASMSSRGSDGDDSPGASAVLAEIDRRGTRREASATYQTRVIASGLSAPTGIALGGRGELYFTQVPTPGVAGGDNSVELLSLKSGERTTLHMGEPEPTNIAVDEHGTLYWTCKSAGVILTRDRSGTTGVLLAGLNQPSGIAVDEAGRNLYFTEVPTPGVSGADGGRNTVNHLDLATLARTVLDAGDPEPVDVAVAKNGDIYWTCKSAGVIVRRAADGRTGVILSGLDEPVGIDIDHRGKTLYFTEVPTPGVRGADGGRNTVNALDLRRMRRTVIDAGDPQPTDVTVARDGRVYWTCTSAGVIVEARVLHGRRVSELLGG